MNVDVGVTRLDLRECILGVQAFKLGLNNLPDSSGVAVKNEFAENSALGCGELWRQWKWRMVRVLVCCCASWK